MVPFRRILLAPLLAIALAASAGPARSTGAETASHPVDTSRAAATITAEEFGVTPAGEAVQRFTLTNTRGSRMRVLTYGGVIQTLEVPDRDGHLDNVVLGFDSLDGYVSASDAYFGALIGRFGNRIANGQFELDGVTYIHPVEDRWGEEHSARWPGRLLGPGLAGGAAQAGAPRRPPSSAEQ